MCWQWSQLTRLDYPQGNGHVVLCDNIAMFLTFSRSNSEPVFALLSGVPRVAVLTLWYPAPACAYPRPGHGLWGRLVMGGARRGNFRGNKRSVRKPNRPGERNTGQNRGVSGFRMSSPLFLQFQVPVSMEKPIATETTHTTHRSNCSHW